MNYWLLKTEPETFGVSDLAALPDRTTCWDGVRNYQARNYLRDGMHKGDAAFIYHSSCEVPGIAGIARIKGAGYPDDTAFRKRHPHYDAGSDPAHPRWYMVDVQLQRAMKRTISLDELRTHADGKLNGMMILRAGNRLSITPVEERHWRFILTLE